MKSIAQNTVFNVTYKLLNMLFPMITSVYLTRVLGPIYLGKVTYAQNVLSYFLVFASFGIPTYGIREIAKVASDNASKSQVFTELFCLNTIFTVICSIAFSILINLWNYSRSDIALYICVGLSLYINVFNVDWFYAGIEEYVYITIRSAIIKGLSILAIFIFVRNQKDYIVYALITSVATTGNYFLNILNLKRKVALCFKEIDLKQHLKPVFILFITMLATDLYNQIDVTMLGIYYTEVEVAYYSSGVKLIRVINSITMAISSTILPRMSLMYEKGDIIKFNKLFSKTLEINILIAVPSSLGIMLISNEIVAILYGRNFYPTADVILVLAPIILIISVSYLVGSVVLTSTNNEKCLLYATFTGGLMNIALNSLFIPNYGMIGAAIASLAAEISVLIIHLFFSNKFIHIYWDKEYYKSILIGLSGMIFVVVLCKKHINSIFLSVFASVLMGGAVYFYILLKCKNKFLISAKNILKQKIKYFMKGR
ncbi:MAG: flippase [Lachnospiraceae bacterium]|nr:flippase [uncultured Acetatifactor sp.]MCI9571677.1 flippase [Lachnospiraceae bacterium]